MRKRIKSSFRNITVIPFPNYKDENKSEYFKSQVEELKQEVAKEVSEPHSSIPLTPQNINDSMENIMEKVKKNKDLDLDSMVEWMQQKIIDNAYKDFKKNFSKKCDAEIPSTARELEEKLEEIKNNLVDTFDKETGTMYLKSEYRKTVREKIETLYKDKLSAMKRKIQGTCIYMCNGLNVSIRVINIPLFIFIYKVSMKRKLGFSYLNESLLK